MLRVMTIIFCGYLSIVSGCIKLSSETILSEFVASDEPLESLSKVIDQSSSLSWTVPNFANWGTSDGDPMVNGIWCLKMGKLSGLSTWSNYEDMEYDTSVSGGIWANWYDPGGNPYQDGKPKSYANDVYGLWPRLRTAGSALPESSWRTVVSLVFTAPESGIYSISATDESKGKTGCSGYQRNVNQAGQTDQYYKVAIDGTMTLLTTITYNSIGSHWIQPQLLPELQNILLQTGEKLVLAVANQSYTGTWWNADLFTGDSDSGTYHGYYMITKSGTTTNHINLLPNASFELPVTGRNYQPGGTFPWAYEHVVTSFDAFEGQRSLLFPFRGAEYQLKSRMIHSKPGTHSFSFYAKKTGGRTCEIAAIIYPNPFTCGSYPAVCQKSFYINETIWTRYTMVIDLPASRDNWYWLDLRIRPGSDNTVYLDGLKLECNDQATEFSTMQDVEFQLDMGGDFSRIYKSTQLLPPLRIISYNASIEDKRHELKVVVKDFWDETVYEQVATVTTAAGKKIITEIPISLNKKGPFRAELYRTDGEFLQDELIFSIVPEITQPVLATQYGKWQPEYRYLYQTLGFKSAGLHTEAKWNQVQPSGPGSWNWDVLDAAYIGLAENFQEVTQVMLWDPPVWAFNKANKTMPWPPSSPYSQQFDLEDYLNYIEAVARRYPNWLYFQPWNEPNYTWQAGEFVEFLRLCRERFNQVNPQIKILAPTCYATLKTWMDHPLDGYLAFGGLQYTDVFAHHTYGCCGAFVPEDLQRVVDWAHADGNVQRPIWNTETALHPYNVMSWYSGLMPSNTGSYSNGNYLPEANTAEEGTERWAKLYLTCTAMGSSVLFSHVAPHASSLLPRLCHLVQAEPDGGRHPMAIAWAIAGHKIGSAISCGSFSDDHIRVMFFKQNNLVKAVVWTRDYEGNYPEVMDPIAENMYYPYIEAMTQQHGRVRKIHQRPQEDYWLNLHPDQVIITDMFDNLITSISSGSGIIFPLSCRPVYLEVNGLTLNQLRAVFSQEIYTLVTSVEDGHGSLTVEPSDMEYPANTVVTVVAEPDSGYTVKAWDGTDDVPAQGQRTNKVTMNSDKSVSVEFALSPIILNWSAGANHYGVGEIWTGFNDSYVESRIDSVNKMVILFNQAMDTSLINSSSVSIVGKKSNDVSYLISSISWDSNRQMKINLWDTLPDQDIYTITLGQEIKSALGCKIEGDSNVTFKVLAGDITGDGIVDKNDIAEIQSHRGQSINATNCRYDINISGKIDNSDMIQARILQGNQLPSE